MNEEITLSVYTVDGTKKRHFKMRKLEMEGGLLVLHANNPSIYYDTKNIEQVYPHDVTLIARFDWWFSLMICRNNLGKLSHVYVNINTPYEMEGNDMKYIDLDIDMLVKPDYSVEILDEDEFRTNIHRGLYTRDWVDNAWNSIEQIKEMISKREKPFDWSV